MRPTSLRLAENNTRFMRPLKTHFFEAVVRSDFSFIGTVCKLSYLLTYFLTLGHLGPSFAIEKPLVHIVRPHVMVSHDLRSS